MEDLVRGNPTEVKVVLASVATALAVYQVILAAIFYRKLRPAFLDAAPAAFTHRASGDTIAALLVVVAIMCLSYFELEDSAFHALTGAIVAIAIVAVTAKLGPTSAAELEAQEERQEQRLEQQEERREDRQDP